MRQQQLDRHVASDPLVARPPHFAHAAGAEPPLDRVAPDRVAGLHAPAVARDLRAKTSRAGDDEEGARVLDGGEQRGELVAQSRIDAARARRGTPRADRRAARRPRRTAARAAASGHWASSLSARYSHARAKAQSVCTVRDDTPERLRRLVDRQAAEEAQLDDLGLAGIFDGEPLEREVDGEHVGAGLARRPRRRRRAGRESACGPPRRSARRRRAMSTARGASCWAETPKKCRRFCQRTASQPSSRRHSSLTSAVACRLTVDRSPIR